MTINQTETSKDTSIILGTDLDKVSNSMMRLYKFYQHFKEGQLSTTDLTTTDCDNSNQIYVSPKF